MARSAEDAFVAFRALDFQTAGAGRRVEAVVRSRAFLRRLPKARVDFQLAAAETLEVVWAEKALR